jgi:hypothetical protein
LPDGFESVIAADVFRRVVAYLSISQRAAFMLHGKTDPISHGTSLFAVDISWSFSFAQARSQSTPGPYPAQFIFARWEHTASVVDVLCTSASKKEPTPKLPPAPNRRNIPNDKMTSKAVAVSGL